MNQALFEVIRLCGNIFVSILHLCNKVNFV